jgi:hypothetical protein
MRLCRLNLISSFDIKQRFAGNAQNILRLWRLVLASSSEKLIHLSLSARRWNALSSTRWQTDAASPLICPLSPEIRSDPRNDLQKVLAFSMRS